MGDYNKALKALFSGTAGGGIITHNVNGGDFAEDFAFGFTTSLIDYTENALGGILMIFPLSEALELTLDFVPLVSNAKALVESLTGKAIFSPRDLSSTERALATASILGGFVVKVAALTGKLATVIIAGKVVNRVELAAILSSKSVVVTKGGMLGANGTKTASKTLWKGKERIDVENSNPGQRPGQIHYQDNKNNKFLYDPETNSFPDAPRSVNKMLNDKKFKNTIDKAMTKYLGE